MAAERLYRVLPSFSEYLTDFLCVPGAEDVVRFHGNTTTTDHFRLMQIDGDHLLVGARYVLGHHPVLPSFTEFYLALPSFTQIHFALPDHS